MCLVALVNELIGTDGPELSTLQRTPKTVRLQQTMADPIKHVPLK